MTKFTALPTIRIPNNQSMKKPRPLGLLDLEDSADEIYMDYHLKRCRTITQSDKLEYAEYLMQRDSAHELVVEDNDRHVVGILSTSDLMGPKALTAANNQRIHHNDLLVKAVMTPLSHIPIMDEAILVHAKVGHIITTINEHQAKFLLVAKQVNASYELSGLFSLVAISHLLHKDVAKAVGISDSILDLKQK
jgi:CBS-domain-containing membrane protein